MPTIADMLREEGREEALEEGRKRLVNTLFKLVQSKFGEVPIAIEERITSVRDLSTLESIIDAAFQSESIDQLQKQMESFFTQ